MDKHEALKILTEHNQWRRGETDVREYGVERLGEAIDMAISVLSRADGWVKVSDGLPKPGENVLLHRDKPYHIYDQTGFQRDGIFYFNHGGEVQKVIRWHLLPQPPKTAQQ